MNELLVSPWDERPKGMEMGEADARWTLHLNRPDGVSVPEGEIRAGVALAMAREKVDEGELSITFLRDDPIRELNQEYLDHDWIPDVLAFPLSQEDQPLHGDIYVGWDQAVRQAEEHGVPLDEELVRLCIHGLLHLLGYDHPEDPELRLTSPLYRVQESVVTRVFRQGGTR